MQDGKPRRRFGRGALADRATRRLFHLDIGLSTLRRQVPAAGVEQRRGACDHRALGWPVRQLNFP